jgi:hypothetical protein
LLAHGQWFSSGTLASSTTKTGRHDIAESGVKHQKSHVMYENREIVFIEIHLIHVSPLTNKKAKSTVKR